MSEDKLSSGNGNSSPLPDLKVDEPLQAVGMVAYVLAVMLGIGAVVLAYSGARDLQMAQYLGFHLSGLSGAD